MLERAVLPLLVVGLCGCGGGSSQPTVVPTPTPSPTPTAALISASPAPRSTVSVANNDPVTLHLRVTSPTDFTPSWLCVDYLATGESSSGSCGKIGCPGACIGQAAPIPANTPQEFVISVGAGSASKTCTYPRTVDRASICLTNYLGGELRAGEVPISYTLVNK